MILVQQTTKSATLLGRIITPETVREVIRKASAIRWGTHLLRWRYFDVHHEGVTYHRNAMVPSQLWHLLKRVYVDQDWPVGTSLEKLDQDARAAVEHPDTEIFVYGYYRTTPPRLQWGFLNRKTRVAVVYDAEADLIVTVFKPVEGALFFERQVDTVRIDRREWKV